MDKVIVFKTGERGCGIICPNAKYLKDTTIEAVAKKDVPAGAEYRITTVDKIPSDRTYRSAWTDENKTDTVDIDVEKARPIHMEKIRKVRDRKLEALDLETLKGRDVQAEKQKLRDLPSKVDLSNARTIDELKAIWPTELN